MKKLSMPIGLVEFLKVQSGQYYNVAATQIHNFLCVQMHDARVKQLCSSEQKLNLIQCSSSGRQTSAIGERMNFHSRYLDITH